MFKCLTFILPFEVSDFFAKLVQRVSPKSYQQAFAEVYVTGKFLENFSGDQVLLISVSNSGYRILYNSLHMFAFKSYIICRGEEYEAMDKPVVIAVSSCCRCAYGVQIFW